jgi:uncharacterized membrane protein
VRPGRMMHPGPGGCGRGRRVTWAGRFGVREYVATSLWVLPLLAALVGPALAAADVRWLDGTAGLPRGWYYSASTATSVLTAIVGAMIGLLGFVVTVGVLVVTTATGALSPRFMRIWYRDRMQRFVLATFVLTFTFSFALLRQVKQDAVPDIGVSVAGIMVTGSVVLLLIYLNRFVHQLRPVAVAALVAQVAHRAAGTSGGTAATGTGPAGRDPGPPEGPAALVVRATRAGAIQAVGFPLMVRLADRYDLVVVLERAIGDFVTTGTPLMRVYGTGADAGRLHGLVALGHERAVGQDPAFALRIMVDIAIRSLSPAVNDPTTAVQVIDHIDDFLQTIARVTPPTPQPLRGPDGRPRVYAPGHTFGQYLRLATTEIVHFGAASPQVPRRLRAMLRDLRDAVDADQVTAVDAVLERLDVAVTRAVADPGERRFSQAADRQGIGGPPSSDPDDAPGRPVDL